MDGAGRPEPTGAWAVERAADLAAAPDEVWAEVVGEGDGAFLGDGAVVEPRAGGRVRAGGRFGVVEIADAPRLLVFRWRPEPGAAPAGRSGGPGAATRVEVRIEPHGSGTRVTVTETAGAAPRIPAVGAA